MEEVNIIDGSKHIKLLLKDHTIFVISEYDVDVNKYFNYMKTIDVYSFYNSGLDSTLYKGSGKDNKKKNFYFGKTVLNMSFTALLLFCSLLNTSYILVPKKEKEKIPDYEVNDLYNLVYSSAYLNYREKDFIYNEEFFSDVLKTINESSYMKNHYSKCFESIKIEKFDNTDHEHQSSLGYYNSGKPNIIHIKDYDDLDDFNKDVISHEFIHLCQETHGYNLIIEASAELISNEYYNAQINSYYDQIKLLKELMEIIGSSPIWHYIFTGDFTFIERSVKPFLTDEEYNDFLSYLSFSYEDYESNYPNFEKLELLLDTLYNRIYRKDINDNIVINLIKNDDKSLHRYYFNKNTINEEESYYLDSNNLELQTMTLSNAIDNDLVQFYSVVRKSIDEDEALKLIEEGTYYIERNIINDGNVFIYKTVQNGGKVYITGYIYGIKYEDADIDELAFKNTINIDYVLVDVKKLTKEEYFNHDYPEDAVIRDFYNETVTIKDDVVEAYMPKKVFIEPVISSLNEKGLIKTR